MNHQWHERPRPARLERRYEFENYLALRDFLDCAAELSEREDLYPDMGFGRNYVNITIHADEGSSSLDSRNTASPKCWTSCAPPLRQPDRTPCRSLRWSETRAVPAKRRCA
ncbi:MAG: 4a-hydroxytetrahydrobiopterin dehydratase [Chromatiaceae bacterium]|nr:4a-hydroxytetrahydrobiopterin dehydratase [Chromatiaceae bacterium]